MPTTNIPFGDPKAQKKWGAGLAVDIAKKAYFERKFIGTSQNSVIQRKTELESDAGDTISFDLSVQLRGKPTYGDNRIEGKVEQLRFYTDEVKIDQVRHGVSAGGKMTRKRTSHNLRQIGKDRLSDYFSRFMDEVIFIYLSGARGINQDFIESTTWTGHAGNPLQAPDTGHILYGGDAISKATVSSNDTMSRSLIERAQVKAEMLQALDPNQANMVPIMIEGEEHYVLLMSPFQAHDLRMETGTGGWMDIQKAAAAAEGRNNPIFKGGLGKINNVVLHQHRNVARFADYGADNVQPAARALFMGAQAGVVAYGTAGGMRYNWTEEVRDAGNEPTVYAGTIFGFKKSRFNDKDFGLLSLDTYAKDPNAAA